MKIGVITSATYAIPTLQLLAGNRLQASVFADGSSQKDNLEVIRYFCTYASMPYRELQPEELYDWVNSYKPDLVFVIGYAHLIDISRLPATLVNSVYNIHFGALPAYRGPNPVFWQIRYGSATLGISIHRISERFDKGPLVWIKDVPRDAHISYGAAHTLLGHQALEGVLYILQYHIRNQPLAATPQVAGGRYYKRPGLQDVSIRWQDMMPQQIIQLILACNPWNKGAITMYNGSEVKILDAEHSKDKPPAGIPLTPGTIAGTGKCLQVVCKGNQLVNINMLVLDGTFVPARQAEKFGFLKGRQLGI